LQSLNYQLAEIILNIGKHRLGFFRDKGIGCGRCTDQLHGKGDRVALVTIGLVFQPETAHQPVQLVIQGSALELQLVAVLFGLIVLVGLDEIGGNETKGIYGWHCIHIDGVVQIRVAITENIHQLEGAEINFSAVCQGVALVVLVLVKGGIINKRTALTEQCQLLFCPGLQSELGNKSTAWE